MFFNALKAITIVLVLTAVGVAVWDFWNHGEMRDFAAVGKAVDAASFAQLKSDLTLFLPSAWAEKLFALPAAVPLLLLALVIDLIRRILALVTGHHANGEKKWTFKR